jgi:hypothetical protein
MITGALWSFHIYNYFYAPPTAGLTRIHCLVAPFQGPPMTCALPRPPGPRSAPLRRLHTVPPDLSFIIKQHGRFLQNEHRRCRRSGCWQRFRLWVRLLVPAKQVKVFTVVIVTKVRLREVELHGSFPAVSSPHPNSSPSQVRFNPDEPKLRLLRIDSLQSITLTHWDWTFAVFRCDIEASKKHFPRILFLGKAHHRFRTWGCWNS